MIENSYPPNYEQIKAELNPPSNAVYAFGEILYNPSGQEIPPDILHHETVHQKQQQGFTSPDLWWSRYILDREYRLECELSAYRAQLDYLKEAGLPSKGLKLALEEFAEMLFLYYNVDKNIYQLQTLLRNYEPSR